MSFRVQVDVTNPGQFFACCGLLELATRLAGDATAHFDGAYFSVHAECTLSSLLDRWTSTRLVQVDAEDDASSPVHVPAPFDLRLDWWKDEDAGGRDLKVWAGTMQSVRIAQAMVASLLHRELHTEDLFDRGFIVYDPDDPAKKVEPFYFDARRAPNAHSRDVGFSPNDLEMTTTAFPAVEALCLVGLQRCRPAPTGQKRVFVYRTWATPIPITLAAPVVSSAVSLAGTRAYRFENWFRTGQKKHKAFRSAVPIGERW
jgi:CRISPR-associated protein Csb3